MTHIGSGASIIGDVQCEDDDLFLEGHVRGRVLAKDVHVTVGPTAHVHGDIRGRAVTVRGQVDGAIWASERIDVAEEATVHGSLSSNTVVICDGAIVNARVDMDQRTIAAAVAKYKAGHAEVSA